MNDRYLSVGELQRFLGVGRSTAYALVKHKGFPASRVGKRIVVSELALKDWLERGGTEQK